MSEYVASERIKNLITKKSLRRVYWGLVFSRIRRIPDISYPTLGVQLDNDGLISLRYNYQFVDQLTDEQLGKILEHEAVHILDKHIPRLLRILSTASNDKEKEEIRSRFNIAADCIANPMSGITEPLTLKNGFVITPHFPKTYNLPIQSFVEQNYLLLKNYEKEENKKNEKNEEDGNSGNATANTGQHGMSGDNIDDHTNWFKEVTTKDLNALARKTENYTVREIISPISSLLRGSLPGYVNDMIQKYLAPPEIPYYQIIRKIVTGSRFAKYKRAYSQINKKRVFLIDLAPNGLPIISPFPGKKRNFTFKITILIDTSGSMSDTDVKEGLKGVKNIIERDKDCDVTVIENDAKVQKVYKCKKVNDIQFEFIGRGGTVLFPGLSLCKQLDSDITLVFTDGACDAVNRLPRKDLPKKILWILTHRGTDFTIKGTGSIVRLPK